MTVYKVTLDIPDVGLKVLEVSDDQYIHDAAEDAGIDVPFTSTCRAGKCSACAAKLVSGTIDQSEQDFFG